MKKIIRLSLVEKSSLKIAIIYAAFSVLWILLSDKLLFFFVKDPEIMTEIQMLKGWVFVLTTALIIFFLLRREIKKHLQTEAALRESEKQLQQAQKMKAIGTLASGIAHDFNNILSAILGYAEMLEFDLPRGSRSHKMQQQIIAAGLRAKDLVQQILLFSRQTDHVLKPVQPDHIVKEALTLIKASIPATIEVQQNIQSDCGRILADPTKIHQIIMNLCTNAYHAMRESGGILSVNLLECEVMKEDVSFDDLQLAPGSYIKFEVNDTGHGMDQETMGKIFDPYFTTKPKGEGTGLGLSVVIGIVKSYGGYIKLYSEPDRGTAIHIYFPKVESEADTLETQVENHIPTGKERILVVDDEAILAEMMKGLLESLGYSVVAYTSSQDALSSFQADPDKFDLVITDMTMPHMTGLELAKQLLVIRPKMPVVLCTGFSELDTTEKAHALGLQCILTKPILRAELSKTIRKVLDNEFEETRQ
jgi:signal transduction histidine kinase/ActR/RegA family two-component response regulator